MSSIHHYSWSAIGQFGTIAIGLLGNIFIARLLTPDDYGLVALLAIMMGLSRNLISSGFGDCLVRKKDADAKDFATVWLYNVLTAIFLYVLFYISAPFIANFFQRGELVLISRVLPLTLILVGIVQTENIRMAKEIAFKRIALIQLLSSSLSFITAYALALKGFSYWAIVAQIISLPFFNLLFNIIFNAWTPFIYFSIERYRSMRKFGLDLLISNLSNVLGEQTYTILIGKHYSTILLGYFNQASRINTNLFQGFNSIVLKTSYPLLAKEENKDIRTEKYKQILNHFTFFHFAMSIAVITCASSLIEVVFGLKWIEMKGYLQLVILSYLFTPLTTIYANSIKIDGKSKLFRNLTFFRNGILLLSALFTYTISMHAVLISMIIARYVSILVDAYFCSHSFGVSPMEQILSIFHQIVSPVLSAIGAFFISSLFQMVFFKLVVFLLFYICFLLLINSLIKNPVQQYYVLKLKRTLAKL